ncbi:MAG: hypothetical protein AAGA45_07170, partial [Verrucomicrobiota bacterium]
RNFFATSAASCSSIIHAHFAQATKRVDIKKEPSWVRRAGVQFPKGSSPRKTTNNAPTQNDLSQPLFQEGGKQVFPDFSDGVNELFQQAPKTDTPEFRK